MRQPSVIVDGGEWHLMQDKLFMQFKGESHPPEARHMECRISMFDKNTVIMQRPDKSIAVFVRSQ